MRRLITPYLLLVVLFVCSDFLFRGGGGGGGAAVFLYSSNIFGALRAEGARGEPWVTKFG